MSAKKFNSERPHIILIVPAVIAGGAALAGAGLTAASQGRMNKKAIKFQREMFDKTNAYNTPLEQRKRLEAAGLNPNLVYGGSPSGVAGTADQPAQPDLKAQDFTTPGAAMGGALSQIYSIKQAEAGIDVNRARESNLKQDTINKGIESVNAALRASSGAIDLKTKQRLYQNTVKTAEERLRQISVDIGYTQNKDAREQMITNQTVQKIQQETNNLKTQGKILSEDALMKVIDRKLYEDFKVRPQDPIYFRIFGQILQELDLNPFKK